MNQKKNKQKPEKTNSSSEPSLQTALNHLAKSFEIIRDNFFQFYTKESSEVTPESLKSAIKSLTPITDEFKNFQFNWIDSKKVGPDAFASSEKLDNRIDIKLLETGKLDFEQLKKIMIRLNRADDIFYAFPRIELYLAKYRDLCKRHNLNDEVSLIDLFFELLFKPTRKQLTSESERFKNQIERLNLYYNSKLSSNAFRIAFISLIVSSISVLLTVLAFFLKA